MTAPGENEEKSVLPGRLAGGPHGLGDPADKRLRKVEREIVIPQKLRDRAKKEKCSQEVANFSKCCKSSGLSMVLKCRPENTALWDCLTKWYEDEQFKKEVTEEYLKDRSIYRETGVRAKMRKKDSSTF